MGVCGTLPCMQVRGGTVCQGLARPCRSVHRQVAWLVDADDPVILKKYLNGRGLNPGVQQSPGPSALLECDGVTGQECLHLGGNLTVYCKVPLAQQLVEITGGCGGHLHPQ